MTADKTIWTFGHKKKVLTQNMQFKKDSEIKNFNLKLSSNCLTLVNNHDLIPRLEFD